MGLDTVVCELVGVGVMVCIGLAWNSFNLVMTFQKQLKTKTFGTMGLIILAISISNNALVVSCFIIVASVSLNPLILCYSVTEPHFLAVLYLWLSSSCMSFWSIAWLSVFYCVKVVSFSTKCLRALKRNICNITNTALLLSSTGSFLLFFPFFTLYNPGEEPGTTNPSNISNTTYFTCTVPMFAPPIDTDFYTMTFVIFLCPFPLMIMLPTSFRMVIYLCQHVFTLRQNQTRVQGLDSYLSVCKLNISLSAVYLTSLTIVAFFFIMKILGLNVSFIVIIFGFSFYCIMTASLLTASEKHLKKKFWRLCCCKKIQE